MKLLTRLKSTIKKLAPKRRKKPNRSKPVKKNTWLRNAKAWNLRFDRRLQQRTTTSIEVDETLRVCPNCGEHYTGRICPQCGQAGTWKRYTWRQAILNFLDIWGLGNRPMFRTIKELFWRPGYMIRDYLDGHRLFYFPPFKLVAVTVVLLVFVGWLTGSNEHSILGLITEFFGLNEAKDWTDITAFAETHFARFHLSSTLMSIASTVTWFIWFLSKHLLYEWLFLGTVFFICIWLAFIRVNKYNFVETYIFLTYVLAQFLLCLVPGDLLSWFGGAIKSLADAGTSSSLMTNVYSGLLGFTDFLTTVYIIAVTFLLFLDFRQFFGLTWKSTLVHLVLTFIVGLTLFAGIASLVGSIVEKNPFSIETWIGSVFEIVLVAQGFYYAAKYLKANKEIVPGSVINGRKTAMLSLLFIDKVTIAGEGSIFSFLLDLFLIVLFAGLSVTLSLLPVVVYKKYHRTWLALLSLSAIFLLLVVVVNLGFWF